MVRNYCSEWHDTDPWLIGVSGLPFVLEIKSDSSAADLALAVDTALFAVDQARLVIAGQDIPYVGEGFLDFTDNSLAGFDLVTFNGVFELNGVQSEVPSFVDLPLNAFQFVAPFETPPTFGNVANVLKSSIGDNYGTIVESGTLVLSVPEAGALSIAFPSICFSLIERRIGRSS
jgi:hypothetical protein